MSPLLCHRCHHHLLFQSHHSGPHPHATGPAPHLGLRCHQVLDEPKGSLGRGSSSTVLTGAVWLDVHHPTSPHRRHRAWPPTLPPRPHLRTQGHRDTLPLPCHLPESLSRGGCLVVLQPLQPPAPGDSGPPAAPGSPWPGAEAISDAAAAFVSTADPLPHAGVTGVPLPPPPPPWEQRPAQCHDGHSTSPPSRCSLPTREASLVTALRPLLLLSSLSSSAFA